MGFQIGSGGEQEFEGYYTLSVVILCSYINKCLYIDIVFEMDCLSTLP